MSEPRRLPVLPIHVPVHALQPAQPCADVRRTEGGLTPRDAKEGIRTTCPYCGVGCGVLARASNDADSAAGEVAISGDPGHPANFGALCSKGAALGETLGLEGRLLHPQIRGQRASWNDALDHVANGFRNVIERHGPQAIALYVSGQLLTEDYYVANKLMKGFIGSANIDTNSRLCMSSAVSGHRRAFGEDLVPICYEDFALADLVVLVGSNTAWCHPVIFERITAARQQRPEMKVVVIDPRRTATCELADLHLPLRAGTDVWLFNGLLAFLDRRGAAAAQFIDAHTLGAGHALAVAGNTAGDLRAVAATCRIDERDLAQFYELFARTQKTITLFSQGVNQSSAGTDKVNSIINCHLLTGRIGRPGMGPFSVTGQPNAMGGREVGGLANSLAAHMEIDDARHRQVVQQFWRCPVIADKPGLKAVELFRAIHQRRIRAVWIVATNPVASLPDADHAREALRRCELVVASDCVQRTDTNAFAHVLLPAAAWGEKDGTVTNSERRISRQRAFMPAPGEARPDWWIISQVARRMGHASGFDFDSAHQIFVEHAALSGAANFGTRAFDISGLATLDRDGYDALEPIQWPVPAAGHAGTARLFRDHRFYHADGKARFVATPPRPPAGRVDEEFPLVLNTGRIRDQWHTMTRSGRAPRLTSHRPEPYVEMHPQDALLAGVRDGELVRVATKWGSLIARLSVSGARGLRPGADARTRSDRDAPPGMGSDIPRGMIFVPIHWSGEFCCDARVGALVNPIVDPVSGEPELKHTPARVMPFVVSWHGLILTRQAPAHLDVTWWAVARGAQFLRYEIAGRRVHGNWSAWARRVLGVQQDDANWLEYCDAGAGVYRGALMVGDRIAGCVFVSPRRDLPSREWLCGLFARERISDAERAGLLIGQPADPQADAGPLVCACFGIGRRTICEAIRNHELTTVQQVGRSLHAGTNCGSCRAEIRMLLAEGRSG